MKIISALKKLFTDKSKKKEPKNDYKIEYYPITGKYFPTYKGYYFDVPLASGIIRLEYDILFGKSCNSEKEAQKYIDMHFEQQNRKNVSVLLYHPKRKQ